MFLALQWSIKLFYVSTLRQFFHVLLVFEQTEILSAYVIVVDSLAFFHFVNILFFTLHVNLLFFISLASVQIYIQIVPLCAYNNVRKQVYMAFELGLFQQVSKDKFILQWHLLFNLTRVLPKLNLFKIVFATKIVCF